MAKNLNQKNMNSFIINGVSIVTDGSNISISNGKILIDGKDYTPLDQKNIEINIIGNVEQIEVDNCNKISIKGDVTNVNSKNGNIEIEGNVGSNVESKNGNISCGNVSGNVESKNGNIRHK